MVGWSPRGEKLINHRSVLPGQAALPIKDVPYTGETQLLKDHRSNSSCPTCQLKMGWRVIVSHHLIIEMLKK